MPENHENANYDKDRDNPFGAGRMAQTIGGGGLSLGGHLQNWPYSTSSTCSGQAHVFACAHELRCKCGKTARVIEPPTACPACGKDKS